MEGNAFPVYTYSSRGTHVCEAIFALAQTRKCVNQMKNNVAFKAGFPALPHIMKKQ